MANRSTMDLSSRCPGHEDRMVAHSLRVQADMEALGGRSDFGKPKRSMKVGERMEVIPGVLPEVVDAFRVQAFKTAFMRSEIKDPHRRFVFAMEQSLQPIRDPGLLECWRDMYHQQPVKGRRVTA